MNTLRLEIRRQIPVRREAYWNSFPKGVRVVKIEATKIPDLGNMEYNVALANTGS